MSYLKEKENTKQPIFCMIYFVDIFIKTYILFLQNTFH